MTGHHMLVGESAFSYCRDILSLICHLAGSKKDHELGHPEMPPNILLINQQ